MAGWPTLRYEWVQTVGGIMKVGDLVMTYKGEYGIVSGFWRGDVSDTLYVHVYLNNEIETFHPAELEVV